MGLFVVFLRFFQSISFEFEEFFLFIFIIFSIFSVIFGSFLALKQKKLKRLLAYSAISHVGYLLLAFASNSIDGISALFFYLIVYIITNFVI